MAKIPWKRCVWHGCRNPVNPNHHANKCPRCQSRWFRKTHPLKYFFNKLKQRAKERRHEFTLTFGQYESFCLNTDYHKLKGKTSLSLSIDRKDGKRGYHADNIQAITLRENTRKEYVPYFREQKYQPDADDIRAAEAAMAESMGENQNNEPNEN